MHCPKRLKVKGGEFPALNKVAFETLIQTEDDMAFAYWENQSLPEQDAHRKQIILACSPTVLAAGEHRETAMVPLIDSSLRGKVMDVAFRRMLHYLPEWFVVHYRRKPEGVVDGRELQVVLDCKPSDGPTLIHLISKLTAKSGMPASAAPNVERGRQHVFV
ncbi:hypothetical protein Q5P01_017874 [Channa striata]|uniref:Uncharacterized protein n=1 Tax=Channa striata TaxID=64152 RepID=A0AA88SDH3_CHASR|nr:hypothetical protein Q5P01_017874 [Channa striata]